MLPSQVAVSITSHVITGTIWIKVPSFSLWTPAIQDVVHMALADDVVPAADNVFITSVADASTAAAWAAVGTAAMPSGATGVLLSYMVDGYSVRLCGTTHKICIKQACIPVYPLLFIPCAYCDNTSLFRPRSAL